MRRLHQLRQVAADEIPGARGGQKEKAYGDDERDRAPTRFEGRHHWLCRGRLADFHGVDSNRLGDVLELGWAEIGHGEIEPPLPLTVSVLGKADRAGLGDAFEPGSDIDPVAHQVAIHLLDHVTKVDAYAELDAALGLHASIAVDEARLYLDGAAHGVD